MATETCPFCALLCQGECPFCPQCGGEVLPPTPLDQLLVRLKLTRQLVRNRVWLRLDRAIALLEQTLTEDPPVRARAEPSLVWLGQEVEALVDVEVHLQRSLHVARRVLPLLPDDRFAKLQEDVVRLTQFVQALLTADREWKQGGPPAPRKIQAWFEEVLDRALLSSQDALGCVYASPDRWPALAAALDPGAFERTRWHLVAARGEQELHQRRYEAAQRHFQAAFAEDPSRLRAVEGLGRVYAKQGNRLETIYCHREAVRLGTPNPTVYKDLAWCLCTAPSPSGPELEEALWAAQRAVELAPVASCWDTLAEVLSQRGEWRGAIAATREAIRDRPDKETYRARMQSLCQELWAASGGACRFAAEDEAAMGQEQDQGEDGSDVNLLDETERAMPVASSPFDHGTDSDIQVVSEGTDAEPRKPKRGAKAKTRSSQRDGGFELSWVAPDDSSSPLGLQRDESGVPAQPVGSRDSDDGINLQAPADTGISLEAPPVDSDDLPIGRRIDSGGRAP